MLRCAASSGIVYGVKMGDIRKLASKLGINHDRAHEWWDSEVPDARWLAILTADPKRVCLLLPLKTGSDPETWTRQLTGGSHTW